MSGPNPLGAIAVGVGAGLLNHFLSPNSENKIELIENIQQCVEAVKILRLREVTEGPKKIIKGRSVQSAQHLKLEDAALESSFFKSDDDRIRRLLHCAEVPVLGFDCEWVDPPNVSLLQLCSHKGYCAVIRLCKFQTLPWSLRDLLSDGKVVKVGVGTTIDCQYLKTCDLPTNSSLDLRFVAKLTGEKAQNLADMYKAIVGGTLKKDLQLSCSNWKAYTLTPQQVQYAADDAIVGIQIYMVLAKRVSDVKIFKKYYDIDYVPCRHDNLESASNHQSIK